MILPEALISLIITLNPSPEPNNLNIEQTIEYIDESKYINTDAIKIYSIKNNNNNEENEYIERVSYIEYELPDKTLDSSFKAYMDYRTITDKTSKQWELQQLAYTDEKGFRRVNDDYCVAMGTAFSDTIGERFKVTLDSETIFTAIVSDIKADRDTDSKNMYKHVNGNTINIIEFVIDEEAMEKSVLRLGCVSSLGFEGSIVKIEKIERVD